MLNEQSSRTDLINKHHYPHYHHVHVLTHQVGLTQLGSFCLFCNHVEWQVTAHVGRGDGGCRLNESALPLNNTLLLQHLRVLASRCGGAKDVGKNDGGTPLPPALLLCHQVPLPPQITQISLERTTRGRCQPPRPQTHTHAHKCTCKETHTHSPSTNTPPHTPTPTPTHTLTSQRRTNHCNAC